MQPVSGTDSLPLLPQGETPLLNMLACDSMLENINASSLFKQWV